MGKGKKNNYIVDKEQKFALLIVLCRGCSEAVEHEGDIARHDRIGATVFVK